MLREYTKSELLKYNGTDKTIPILIAVKGKIFDVSAGAKFYGPAGRDASYILGASTLEEEDVDKPIDGFNESEKRALDGWLETYEKKYRLVGWLSGWPSLSLSSSSSSSSSSDSSLSSDYVFDPSKPFFGPERPPGHPY